MQTAEQQLDRTTGVETPVPTDMVDCSDRVRVVKDMASPSEVAVAMARDRAAVIGAELLEGKRKQMLLSSLWAGSGTRTGPPCPPTVVTVRSRGKKKGKRFSPISTAPMLPAGVMLPMWTYESAVAFGTDLDLLGSKKAEEVLFHMYGRRCRRVQTGVLSVLAACMVSMEGFPVEEHPNSADFLHHLLDYMEQSDHGFDTPWGKDWSLGDIH